MNLSTWDTLRISVEDSIKSTILLDKVKIDISENLLL